LVQFSIISTFCSPQQTGHCLDTLHQLPYSSIGTKGICFFVPLLDRRLRVLSSINLRYCVFILLRKSQLSLFPLTVQLRRACLDTSRHPP